MKETSTALEDANMQRRCGLPLIWSWISWACDIAAVCRLKLVRTDRMEGCVFFFSVFSCSHTHPLLTSSLVMDHPWLLGSIYIDLLTELSNSSEDSSIWSMIGCFLFLSWRTPPHSNLSIVDAPFRPCMIDTVLFLHVGILPIRRYLERKACLLWRQAYLNQFSCY
jgi:hypothetical protein